MRGTNVFAADKVMEQKLDHILAEIKGVSSKIIKSNWIDST